MDADSKTYRITLDGKQYTGTAEEVARWYCKQKRIELCVLPGSGDGVVKLYASFPGIASPLEIASFKNDLPYTDVWYKLFFRQYINQKKDLDCRIEECAQSNPSPSVSNDGEMSQRLIEYMDRLHPERDACLEVAGRIACEVMRGYDPPTIVEVDFYIETMLEIMRKTYPKLLELRRKEWA